MIEPTRWERAYQRFETPEQEVAKFLRRLRTIGADTWDRRWGVLEVCSGRGNGLEAWRRLGFQDVCGVDLSPALVSSRPRRGDCAVGDARRLPLRDRSRDIVVVQGGLHHLLTFADVVDALAEMRRVAKPNGRIVIIEPWLTPFLTFVHLVSERRIMRRLSPKLDAFATMAEEEQATYAAWLRRSDDLMSALTKHIHPLVLRRRWGKIILVGTPA